MKKLIISAAIVCAAIAANAASFNWNTTSKLYGVVAANVLDNGAYAAATSGTTDRGDKVLSALTYTLTILDATTGAEIGSANGTVTYGSLGKVGTSSIDVADAAQGTAYKYQLTLTGTQSNLAARGEDATAGFDYTSAIVTTTLSGDVTTATMGNTELGNIVPTTWTVSGITKAGGGSDVPEPTSGLLLALGGAMLALRRRRA